MDEFNKNQSKSPNGGRTQLKVPKSQVQGFKNPKLLLMPNQQLNADKSGPLQGSYWMIVDEDDEEEQQPFAGYEQEEEAIIRQIQDEQKAE